MKERWFVTAKRADFQQIGTRFGIDPVIARIIRNRDVVGEDQISKFLYGTTDMLYDPELLYGMSEAADLLTERIRDGHRIMVIGDYDIDGVTSTYILVRALQMLGADVLYEIPERLTDGYGLNIRLIEKAHAEGADTILTCDNGISAVEQIKYAKSLGMTVIVTDHHEPLYKETEAGKEWVLPPADVLTDPKLPEDQYPFKHICGAVVAWKLVQTLFRRAGRPDTDYLCFLPYAAIATVGDVMDLQDENRIIVRSGLTALERTEDPGLRALIRACGLEGKQLVAYHIGFVIGPCINAGGRLDTARRALKLLLTSDANEAAALASSLCELNEERKDLTARGVEEASRMVEETELGNDRVLVIYLPGCHESIAGIIAGKIRERYYRPTLILTDSAEEGMLKGSGRSTEEYSMFDELVKCSDLLAKFGGHPLAAGLSLKAANLDAFRRRLNEVCTLTEDQMTAKVMIDVPMPLVYISEPFVEQLHVLEPFGKGNSKPLFAEKDLKILSARILGKNRNVLKLRVSGQGGSVMDAMSFGDPDALLDFLAEKFGESEKDAVLFGRPNNCTLSVVYYPQINEFRDVRTPQIIIEHYC